ncbi:uncharacterized protein LOC135819709 [Sycon ciliatum]|uniref:uncharacterized protein LOC135819709 n=1 Tax=Sycon ciliatum TaxID=27933 RepID=UPI0031F6F928
MSDMATVSAFRQPRKKKAERDGALRARAPPSTGISREERAWVHSDDLFLDYLKAHSAEPCFQQLVTFEAGLEKEVSLDIASPERASAESVSMIRYINAIVQHKRGVTKPAPSLKEVVSLTLEEWLIKNRITWFIKSRFRSEMELCRLMRLCTPLISRVIASNWNALDAQLYLIDAVLGSSPKRRYPSPMAGTDGATSPSNYPGEFDVLGLSSLDGDEEFRWFSRNDGGAATSSVGARERRTGGASNPSAASGRASTGHGSNARSRPGASGVPASSKLVVDNDGNVQEEDEYISDAEDLDISLIDADDHPSSQYALVPEVEYGDSPLSQIPGMSPGISDEDRTQVQSPSSPESIRQDRKSKSESPQHVSFPSSRRSANRTPSTPVVHQGEASSHDSPRDASRASTQSRDTLQAPLASPGQSAEHGEGAPQHAPPPSGPVSSADWVVDDGRTTQVTMFDGIGHDQQGGAQSSASTELQDTEPPTWSHSRCSSCEESLDLPNPPQTSSDLRRYILRLASPDSISSATTSDSSYRQYDNVIEESCSSAEPMDHNQQQGGTESLRASAGEQRCQSVSSTERRSWKSRRSRSAPDVSTRTADSSLDRQRSAKQHRRKRPASAPSLNRPHRSGSNKLSLSTVDEEVRDGASTRDDSDASASASVDFSGVVGGIGDAGSLRDPSVAEKLGVDVVDSLYASSSGGDTVSVVTADSADTAEDAGTAVSGNHGGDHGSDGDGDGGGGDHGPTARDTADSGPGARPAGRSRANSNPNMDASGGVATGSGSRAGSAQQSGGSAPEDSYHMRLAKFEAMARPQQTGLLDISTKINKTGDERPVKSPIDGLMTEDDWNKSDDDLYDGDLFSMTFSDAIYSDTYEMMWDLFGKREGMLLFERFLLRTRGSHLIPLWVDIRDAIISAAHTPGNNEFKRATAHRSVSKLLPKYVGLVPVPLQKYVQLACSGSSKISLARVCQGILVRLQSYWCPRFVVDLLRKDQDKKWGEYLTNALVKGKPKVILPRLAPRVYSLHTARPVSNTIRIPRENPGLQAGLDADQICGRPFLNYINEKANVANRRHIQSCYFFLVSLWAIDNSTIMATNLIKPQMCALYNTFIGSGSPSPIGLCEGDVEEVKEALKQKRSIPSMKIFLIPQAFAQTCLDEVWEDFKHDQVCHFENMVLPLVLHHFPLNPKSAKPPRRVARGFQRAAAKADRNRVPVRKPKETAQKPVKKTTRRLTLATVARDEKLAAEFHDYLLDTGNAQCLDYLLLDQFLVELMAIDGEAKPEKFQAAASNIQRFFLGNNAERAIALPREIEAIFRPAGKAHGPTPTRDQYRLVGEFVRSKLKGVFARFVARKRADTGTGHGEIYESPADETRAILTVYPRDQVPLGWGYGIVRVTPTGKDFNSFCTELRKCAMGVYSEKIKQFEFHLCTRRADANKFYANDLNFHVEITRLRGFEDQAKLADMTMQKREAIVNKYLDSCFPPWLQVDLTPKFANDIMLAVRSIRTTHRTAIIKRMMFADRARKLLTYAQSAVFHKLLPAWAGFCLMLKNVPHRNFQDIKNWPDAARQLADIRHTVPAPPSSPVLLEVPPLPPGEHDDREYGRGDERPDRGRTLTISLQYGCRWKTKKPVEEVTKPLLPSPPEATTSNSPHD